jgi:outer membrane protein TolC
MESAQSRYEERAALARVGQTSRLDELSARVDMENQRPQARSAETLYANALDSFKAVLGIEREAGLSLQGSLEYSGAVVASEDSRGSSLETAAPRQGIEALEAQRKAAWHEAYIPSLRFSWNARQSSQLADPAPHFVRHNRVFRYAGGGAPIRGRTQSLIF